MAQAAVRGGNIQYAPPARPPRPATAFTLPPFPGLDARGVSWHTDCALFGCRSNPCNVPFCQACAVHGHTVDECRKRIYNNPAANTSGYWQEKKPGCAPIKFTKPTVNAAVQAQAQSFPVPYQMYGVPAQQPASNGNSAAVNHTATQQPTNQQGSAGSSAK